VVTRRLAIRKLSRSVDSISVRPEQYKEHGTLVKDLIDPKVRDQLLALRKKLGGK